MKVVEYKRTVEFQKRVMSHAHRYIILRFDMNAINYEKLKKTAILFFIKIYIVIFSFDLRISSYDLF